MVRIEVMADYSKNNQSLPDRTPPQNIEAEKSLLGSLMIDRNAIVKVVDFLQPRDFYKNQHQAVYDSMRDLFDRNETIDLLSLSSRLQEKGKLETIGGKTYLTELVNAVPNAMHVLDYAKIVQKKRILRDLIQTSYEIGNMGFNEEEDVDILLDKAESQIFNIAQHSLSQQFTPIKNELEGAFERIDNLSKHKGTPRGVPTGFVDLDKILSGLQKSDLVILAARPSIGKSGLALDIARYIGVNEKKPVGLFSLEMSKDQIIDRFIASQSNVDLWKLRTGHLSGEGPENDFERIQHALGVLSEAPIFIDDTAGINIMQMRAMARRLQVQHGLGLLIVDYLQLMEPRIANMQMVQQMTEISRSLKGLAKELAVPVLALSQLSRAVEQRTPSIPKLSDLRESGCLMGDTLITRADTGERIPIKDLVGQNNIPVHSLDENWQIKTKRISKIFCSGEKIVYELKLRSGSIIKASANHPFKKIDGWFRLDQLKSGDLLATPKNAKIEGPKNELSKNEIILLAHLLGDGCVLKRQPIHYTSNDWDNIKIVERTSKKLFNIKPRIVRQENWWHIYLPSPYRLSRDKHHPIVNWYGNLGLELCRSWEKRIPQKIYSSDNNLLALFLHHLWATDGSISLRKEGSRGSAANIYYATTSRKMAEGVKHLLLRFGIRSKIVEGKKGNYRICYQIHIQGRQHQLMFLETIGSFGKRGKIVPNLTRKIREIKANTNLDIWPKESWQALINPIREDRDLTWRELSAGIQTQYCGSSLFKSGVGVERLQRIAQVLDSEIIYQMSVSDIFWDQVISIRPIGKELVYDATVPETHNFVADNIIVHNSIEQDADVVLFIYRGDKYRQDTARKNIADILVAKHRNGPVGKVELYFDEPRASFRNLEKRELEDPEGIELEDILP